MLRTGLAVPALSGKLWFALSIDSLVTRQYYVLGRHEQRGLPLGLSSYRLDLLKKLVGTQRPQHQERNKVMQSSGSSPLLDFGQARRPTESRGMLMSERKES